MGGGGAQQDAHLPLFEIKQAKGRIAQRLFACTVLVGICLIWIYRILCFPRAGEKGRWAWVGMFVAELWFSFYWLCTQSARWNVSHLSPFRHRLLQRHGDKLPRVDIFVCTADPKMEPPILVMNTVLSVMSFNYPTEKLAVYLSDDGGSDLTFFALLEASRFAKSWIPFCKRHATEPMSPEAYFAQNGEHDVPYSKELLIIKELYEEMKNRIKSISEEGSISKEIRKEHKGFLEWNDTVTKANHQSIVQVIIDGRETTAVDNDGSRLPTLVYMAREKRPGFPHNFKAGAMNALIRVSSEISSGSIILNLDCDMCANDSNAIQDALCFFMDEQKGHEIAYVQHPQTYKNLTKNDLYANSYSTINKVELRGIGGYGSALYCGTGCFHRRESLYGKEYSEDTKQNWQTKVNEKTVEELEATSKVLASCSYEKGTGWGKEMGLVYGCAVEDIVTGLSILYRGWKSVYFYPDREAFVGVGPDTLEMCLIQHQRWSEGMFQVFYSKYCPFTSGSGKLKLGAQMAICTYLLWTPTSLPTLYYVIVPPLCMLHGCPLFPKVSSPWFVSFAYVFMAKNVYGLVEALTCGQTLKSWWNSQRMWLIRRTTAYFFAGVDTILKLLGLSQTNFVLTAKVVTEDVLKRYEQEIMEFGSTNVMFTITATLAMLNLFALIGTSIRAVVGGLGLRILGEMFIPQIVLCGLTFMLYLPVYQALFIRNDKGRMPSIVMYKSVVLASLACLMALR